MKPRSPYDPSDEDATPEARSVTRRRYLRSPRDGKGKFEPFTPDPDLAETIDACEYPLPDAAYLTADWAYGWDLVRHDLTTRHAVDGHGRNVYTAVCVCGWESRPCIFPHEAVREGNRHP